MDCSAWLRNIIVVYRQTCEKYENINDDSGLGEDLVNNTILSLHLGIGLWLKGREW